VTRKSNGDLVGGAHFDIGSRPTGNESDSTGNMTDASNSTQSFNATIPAVWGKQESLTSNPHRSEASNSGYTHGFLGENLTGTHTKDFFYGYENGTEFHQFDIAYAAALTGKQLNSPPFGHFLLERQYYMGNNSGTRDRYWMFIDPHPDDTWARSKYSPLPAQTADNYTNYYIGFDNGAYAADGENQHSTTYYHNRCGSDHNPEYCTGFKAGWNYEANADWQ
jgi:hypothetical protein